MESPVFCTAMFAPPGERSMAGVPVRRFRYVFPWLGLSATAKAKLKLKGGSPLSFTLFIGLLKEKNVSVIHSHVQHRLGGMARTAARLRRIPYVVSIHGGFFTLPEDQIDQMTEPFRGKLEWGKIFGWMLGSRKVLQDADAVICVGQNEYAEVARRYPSARVYYVPNGVCVSRFSQVDGALFREAYHFAPSEKLVLCVSRIDYQKNQLGLLRAFAAFAKDHPDHTLVMIGPVTVERYHAAVLAEIEALQLNGRVRIIEGLRPDDPLLPSAYKAAEMFVLPSLHEPFGIVVLEAWAAGLPVAAYEVGGIPGFSTHNENILLVKKEDEAGLAACMSELADQPALRTALAKAAYAQVSLSYDWTAVTKKMERVYQEIMG